MRSQKLESHKKLIPRVRVGRGVSRIYFRGGKFKTEWRGKNPLPLNKFLQKDGETSNRE